MLVCAFCCARCTRDRGCSAHPVFPAPSVFEGGKRTANLGRIAPRDRGRTFKCEQRHCEEPLRRSNPFFLYAARWIASLRAMTEGMAHSRDALAAMTFFDHPLLRRFRGLPKDSR